VFWVRVLFHEVAVEVAEVDGSGTTSLHRCEESLGGRPCVVEEWKRASQRQPHYVSPIRGTLVSASENFLALLLVWREGGGGRLFPFLLPELLN